MPLPLIREGGIGSERGCAPLTGSPCWSMLLMLLYRSVSKQNHKEDEGRLVPKGKGEKFTHIFRPSEHLYPSRSILVGECGQNAVVTHQNAELKHEQQFRSAGVSTTPVVKHHEL